MDNVLETVNHTTLEALGFAYKGEQTIVHPDWDAYTVDVFERKGLIIHINEKGASLATSRTAQHYHLSLEVLKCWIKDGQLAALTTV